MSSILSLIRFSDSRNPTQDNGLLRNVHGNAFRSKLEKHLSDHRAGEGNLSQAFYENLEKLQRQTATLLQTDPQSARLYSGYLTAGLSYDKRARLVSGISDAVITAANLKKKSPIDEVF